MTHETVEAIYAIRHKESGKFIRANGKGCWMGKSAAQSSFNSCYWGGVRNKSKDQDEYEIVDILELLLDEQLGRKFDCEILSSVLKEDGGKIVRLEQAVEDLEERLAVFFP